MGHDEVVRLRVPLRRPTGFVLGAQGSVRSAAGSIRSVAHRVGAHRGIRYEGARVRK